MALDRVLHGGQKPRTVAEVEADRLRDAAPDLLAALRKAEDAMSVHMAGGCRDAFHDTLRTVRAAIAKAISPCLALLMLFSLAALNGCAVAVDEGLIILSDTIDRSDAAKKEPTP